MDFRRYRQNVTEAAPTFNICIISREVVIMDRGSSIIIRVKGLAR